MGNIQIPGNPEPRKNPSLITQPAGEQLEALTPLCLGRLHLFPHASFSLFARSLARCSRTNAKTFQEDIYNPRHPSDQQFPATFSPQQLAVEFLRCYALYRNFSMASPRPLQRWHWESSSLAGAGPRWGSRTPVPWHRPGNHSLTLTQSTRETQRSLEL